MAFTTTTGAFTTDKGIQALIDEAAKKKKATTTAAAGATAVTEPANVFASETSAGAATTPVATEAATATSAPVTDESSRGISNLANNTYQYPTTTTDASTIPAAPATITSETHYISDDPTSPYYWETLGYSDADWVGLPLEIGYWQEQTDGTQVWIQTKDMTSTAQQLYDLAHTEIPESPELIDLTTTSAATGIQELIDIWNDPNTAIADRDAAVAQFAKEMGMTSDELTAMLNGMVNQSSLGVQGQTGLSEEYQDAYNRQTSLELQDMQNNYKQMIEAMSAQGRDVAGFMAMDTIANEMSSYQMTRDIELMNMDMAAKQAEFDANLATWQTLYEQKEMTAQQLIDNIQTNRVNALTGYAQQITTFYQQNQQTLAAYSADLEAASLHAEIAYKSIMADIGVSESMMTQMQDYYEMYMAPYYTALEQWSIQNQAEQQDQANFWTGLSTVFTGIAAVAFLIKSSAICREMYRQGLFPKEFLEMDTAFGLIVMTRRPDIFEGYRRVCDWAIPKMRKSHAFTMFVNIFFQAWIKDMAVLMGRSKKGSLLGRFVNKFGFWFCSKLGRKDAEVRYGWRLGTI